MKEIKNILKKASKDRVVLFSMILLFIFGIIFFASVVSGVQFFDRLIHVRYTVFGRTNLYKDVWSTRIFISLIGLFAAFFGNLIVAKLNSIFGRRMAVFFAVLNIVILVLSMIISMNILREIPN